MNISLFNSTMAEDPDLEDGEIEDDEEEDDCVVVAVKPAEPPKPVEKEPSPQKKKSADSHQSKKSTTTSSSSRKDKHQNPDEDDFMSKIENALAEGLKRSGIEPPMPNIKKQEQEPEPECRSTRKNRKRKKTRQEQKDQRKKCKDQKRENVARVSERFESCALATTCLVSETNKNQRERRILHGRRESRSVGQRIRSGKQQQLRLRGVPSKQL